MPMMPRLPAWMPWAAAFVLIIAFAASEWSAAISESEAEAKRLREREAAIAASQAHDEAMRERMYDAVIQASVKQQVARKEEAVLAPKAKEPARRTSVTKRTSLPSTTTTLNCKRLREAYSPDELATMPTFQQTCQ